jgi:hypothetical protein
LWFLWLALINTAIILFAGQILRHWIDPLAFISLFVADIIALIIYEYFFCKKKQLFASRWLPRIIGFAIISSLTVAAIVGIVTEFEESGHTICILLAIGSYVGAFLFYSLKVYDLAPIAVTCLCIIALIFTALLKVSNFDAASIFFIGGFIIVGLTIVSTLVLIKINNAWKAKL